MGAAVILRLRIGNCSDRTGLPPPQSCRKQAQPKWLVTNKMMPRPLNIVSFWRIVANWPLDIVFGFYATKTAVSQQLIHKPLHKLFCLFARSHPQRKIFFVS